MSNEALRRRQRLADKLMGILEDLTEKMHNGYYVDLFVRKSNSAAINMYKRVCIHHSLLFICLAPTLQGLATQHCRNCIAAASGWNAKAYASDTWHVPDALAILLGSAGLCPDVFFWLSYPGEV